MHRLPRASEVTVLEVAGAARVGAPKLSRLRGRAWPTRASPAPCRARCGGWCGPDLPGDPSPGGGRSRGAALGLAGRTRGLVLSKRILFVSCSPELPGPCKGRGVGFYPRPGVNPSVGGAPALLSFVMSRLQGSHCRLPQTARATGSKLLGDRASEARPLAPSLGFGLLQTRVGAGIGPSDC